MRQGVLFPAAALFIALSACTTEEATPLPATSTPSPVGTPSPALTPSLPPTPSPTPTPSAIADADGPFAILDDRKGDGGAADMTEVRMMTDSGSLTVLVTLAADAPTESEFGIFINLASTDGEVSRQLGMKWSDGEVSGPFSFDGTTVQQTNYDDESLISVDGRKIATTFPAEVIEGLGESWQWQAVTSLEGEDQDFAPASEETSDFPG